MDYIVALPVQLAVAFLNPYKWEK